jgi:hypothetical protein
VDLGHRFVVAEPVERLADHDHIDPVVPKRDRFRTTVQRFRAWNRSLELAQHRLAGLDRDDVCTGGHEGSRQLPGPRAEVEDLSARTQVESLSKPLDRVARIIGSSALVQVGNELERTGLRML